RWSQRYHVPGATELSLGFGDFWLPDGISVRVYDEQRRTMRGPYTSADNKPHRELWVPVVPGDTMIVEISANKPKGQPVELQAPALKIIQVNAGYRDLFGLEGKPDLTRGGPAPCNIDVVCPQADNWRDELRAVARYTIVLGGGTFLCTGQLIADEPRSLNNLFLTADHCGPSPSSDQTMIFYWNFESPACGQLGGGSLSQAQSGAIFRASRQNVDFSLVELEDEPLQDWNVYYIGWDRSFGNIPGLTVGIHHPGGNEKMISLNTNGTLSQQVCIAGTNDPNGFIFLSWEQGITEPGSSGSGLFRGDNKKLVGVLSGGTQGANCSNVGFDCYGRFASAWDGSTASTRLRDWLDPNGTDAVMVDGFDPNVGICGDAVVVGAENCDDGNVQSGDGCSASCQVEAGFACTLPVSTAGLRDGSFEGGTPNPDWHEFSMNNDEILCTGPGCSGGLAEDGSWFAWFGRASNEAEVGFLEQTLIIPVDATTFAMQVVAPICDSANDLLRVTIDDSPIIQIDGDDLDYCPTFAYVPVSGDVTPFADGGVHVLRIEAQQHLQGGSSTDFFIDSLALDGSTGGDGTPSICTPLPETCFADDFSAGLGNWTTFATGANPAGWGITNDGTCNSNPATPDGNFTSGSGDAACVDADAAGPGVIDAYLCGPSLNFGTIVDPRLVFDYSYQIDGVPDSDDLLAVLVGNAPPGAATIGGYTAVWDRTIDAGAEFNVPGFDADLPLDSFAGQSVHVCFRYRADDDWYAQIDNVAVRASQCESAIDT
ncbi:MAG: choice-of-anchor J domain-containing protein, partial [Gammaproteobacteria bacterium]|nr:choice-of-anchor J domain-containing protein [Gammaproteobacteria bacterium]